MDCYTKVRFVQDVGAKTGRGHFLGTRTLRVTSENSVQTTDTAPSKPICRVRVDLILLDYDPDLRL